MNNASGLLTPSNALPTLLAAGLAADSKLNRLELEDALSGGMRVVVDVYIVGRKRTINKERTVPAPVVMRVSRRSVQRRRRL
jgi:hypothetical protein